MGVLALYFGFSCYRVPTGWCVTYFGEVPEGLVELKDYHNPVYLFVPPGHDKLLLNSMILLIADAKEKPDALVQEWLKVAKKKNMIVAVPDLKMNPADVPYRTDEWLLKLKKDVGNQYHVARTYVIGKGAGAHYAAYLALQHPKEFAGAGLMDGAWAGSFEKLMHLSGRPAEQVPVFVSLTAPGAELNQAAEKWGYRFSNKGYPVYMEKFGQDEKVDSVDLKVRMIDWLQKTAETWARVIANKGKTKKEKISKWTEEFFFSPVHH